MADICTTGYTKRIRHVPAVVKHQVYAEYARESQGGNCCEVDHLIPLELGGSNRATNLWPEPYNIEWNAHIKDRLEGRLHRMGVRWQTRFGHREEGVRQTLERGLTEVRVALATIQAPP